MVAPQKGTISNTCARNLELKEISKNCEIVDILYCVSA